MSAIIARIKSTVLPPKKYKDKSVFSPQYLNACEKPIRAIKKDDTNWNFETCSNNTIPPYVYVIILP